MSTPIDSLVPDTAAGTDLPATGSERIAGLPGGTPAQPRKIALQAWDEAEGPTCDWTTGTCTF